MQKPAWRKSVRCKTNESRHRLNLIYCLHFEVGINVVLSRTSHLVHDVMNTLSVACHLRGLQNAQHAFKQE